MRKLLYLISALVVGGVIVAVIYPAGSARLASDTGHDALAIGTGIATLRENGQSHWDRVQSPVQQLAHDLDIDVFNIASPVPATPVATAPPDLPPSPPGWQPPSVFPAKDDWTWTTVSGNVYSHVKVVGMREHSVTIIYTGGGDSLPLSDLSPDLRKELGYGPAVAESASENTPPPPDDSATPGAPPSAPVVSQVDPYQATIAQARAHGKKMLLLFTGSTWCPTCIGLERYVLPTPRFQSFASGYVMIKVEMAQQNLDTEPNQILAKKYGVQGLPTLITTTPDGAVIGRTLGCATEFNQPGSLDGFLDMLTHTLDPSTAAGPTSGGLQGVPSGL